jgi:hypothetical protein
LIDENGPLGNENRELRKQFKIDLGRTSSHHGNFLECIRTGNRPLPMWRSGTAVARFAS